MRTIRPSTPSSATRLLTILFVALALRLPVAVEAVPITLSLDNPNAVVVQPSSGSITVNFFGTITVDPAYHLFSWGILSPYNATLTSDLGFPYPAPEFTAFVGQSGTYTGLLFWITVTSTTPLDFYGYDYLGNPCLFFVDAEPIAGGETTNASQAYSVLVTNGFSVPDYGSSMALFGMSLGGLCLFQRIARRA